MNILLKTGELHVFLDAKKNQEGRERLETRVRSSACADSEILVQNPLFHDARLADSSDLSFATCRFFLRLHYPKVEF